MPPKTWVKLTLHPETGSDPYIPFDCVSCFTLFHDVNFVANLVKIADVVGIISSFCAIWHKRKL